MILESIIVGAAIVYFLSWLTGVIEGLLFSRYIRKSFPAIAQEHFPGVIKSSISKQWKTRAWLKSRRYTEHGNADLTQRADLHRKISGIAFVVMVIAFVALISLSVAYKTDLSNNSSQTPAEHQPTNP